MIGFPEFPENPSWRDPVGSEADGDTESSVPGAAFESTLASVAGVPNVGDVYFSLMAGIAATPNRRDSTYEGGNALGA